MECAEKSGRSDREVPARVKGMVYKEAVRAAMLFVGFEMKRQEAELTGGIVKM